MYYIIQENLFQIRHFEMLIETLNKFDLKYQVVKQIPFTREIVFTDPITTSNVYCFGSVKMAHIAEDYKWTPGSFMNSNHDYRIYSQYYRNNMLNWDSKIVKFVDDFIAPGYLFFARPCEDTKTFTGQVFTKDSWNDFVNMNLTNGHTTTLNKDTVIQVCSIKDIQREIRVWVVKGKVITASQYRNNERTIYIECTEPYILNYAQSMVDLYQPADAFVIDIAMVNDELKIVEINCINCAGFYNCNIQKLINSLEDNFNIE